MDLSTKNWATEYNFQAVKDGKVKKIPLYGHKLSYGSYGLFFNTRKKKFWLSLKFVWRLLNYSISHGQINIYFMVLTKETSYFPNSLLLLKESLKGKELELLEPLKDKLPFELLTKKFVFPLTKQMRILNSQGLKLCLC